MTSSVKLSLKLIIVSGKDSGAIYPLSGDTVTIGRDPGSVIRLSDSRVSGKHARISCDDGAFFIEDSGSANGTYLNSELIEKSELSEDDIIKLGHTLIAFTTAESAEEFGDAIISGHTSDRSVKLSGGAETRLPGQTIEMSVPNASESFEGTPPETDIGLEGFVETHRKLSLLYKISKELSSLSDLDRVSEMLLRIIFDEIRVDRGVLMLYRRDEDRLDPVKTRVLEPGRGAEQSIQVSETVVNYVTNRQTAVLTDDAMRDQRFSGTESIVMQGVRSVMCVPLVVKNDLIGIVYVDRLSRNRAFTREDLRFFTALCNQAAVNIKNSQLYDEVRVANDELKNLNAELLKSNEAYREANEKLQASYRKLEEAQRRLVQSEKMSSLGRFVAGIAHDLKNMLAPIYGYASLLKTCKDDAKRLDMTGKLIKATDLCTGMVRDLLSFARAERLDKAPAKLNELIDEAVDFVTRQCDGGKDVRIERNLDGSIPEILVDKSKMIRVFNNIVRNAVQAVDDSPGEGTVSISSAREGDHATVIISDTGAGIPEENLARVFDPFFTTKSGTKGTGLGLSLCHGIVTGHGGEISAQSKTGQGAVFTIRLPIEKR